MPGTGSASRLCNARSSGGRAQRLLLGRSGSAGLSLHARRTSTSPPWPTANAGPHAAGAAPRAARANAQALARWSVACCP
eukprot:3358881-Lingulodinium_polyedra.AAC.1